MSFQSPGVSFNYKQYDMEDSVPDIHAAWDEQHFSRRNNDEDFYG